MSVRELLSQSELGARLVQAGSPEREISWVTEGPVGETLPHLTRQALLFTDPLVFQGSWRDTVSALARKQVAALGLRRDTGDPVLPTELTQAAGDFRLGLVEIPRCVPLAQVTRVFFELQRGDELRRAREVLFTQQRVLDLASGGSGPAGVVSAVSQLTGRPVAFVLRPAGILAATANFPREQLTLPHAPLQRLSVGDGRELVVSGPPLSAEGMAALTSAAIVLSVETRSNTVNTVLERERWGRVTRAIVTGEGDPEALTTVLDPALTLPDEVHVLVVQGPAETVAQWRALPRQGLSRLTTRYPLQSIGTTETAPGVVVAWQVVTPQTLPDALHEIRAHGLDAIVGVRTSFFDAPVSRVTAEALLPRLTPQRRLYDDDHPSTVLTASDRTAFIASFSRHAEGKSLASHTLGSLSLTHPHPQLTLRRTLEAFLTHHGQRNLVAEALNIHRNTLRGRLSKIEAATGRTLDSADDRAELLIALRLEAADSHLSAHTMKG